MCRCVSPQSSCVAAAGSVLSAPAGSWAPGLLCLKGGDLGEEAAHLQATYPETVATLQPAYPIALDVQGEIAHAFGGVDSTPTSFLVDPAGNIQYVERGALDEGRVRATVLTFQ